MRRTDIKELNDLYKKDVISEIEEVLVKDLSDSIDKQIMDELLRPERELRERIAKREKTIDELLNEDKESESGDCES